MKGDRDMQVTLVTGEVVEYKNEKHWRRDVQKRIKEGKYPASWQLPPNLVNAQTSPFLRIYGVCPPLKPGETLKVVTVVPRALTPEEIRELRALDERTHETHRAYAAPRPQPVAPVVHDHDIVGEANREFKRLASKRKGRKS